MLQLPKHNELGIALDLANQSGLCYSSDNNLKALTIVFIRSAGSKRGRKHHKTLGVDKTRTGNIH